MTTINQARFKIDGTPSEDPTTGDPGYVAAFAQTLDCTLEISPSSALSVTYSIFDPTDESSPLASYGAPSLTWVGSGLSSKTLASPNGTAQIIMPGAGVASFIIRCTAVMPEGAHTYERLVAINAGTVPAVRKTVPAEVGEFYARGWSDEQNKMVDAIAAAVSGGIAIFEDQRPGDSSGGAVLLSKWVPRTLTHERFNSIPARAALESFDIVAVSIAGPDTITVDGDQTAYFVAGHSFTIRDSTGNDKPNAADSVPYLQSGAASYDAGTDTTTITVAHLASAVADGAIYTGRVILQPGTYDVDVDSPFNAGASTGALVRIAEMTGFTYHATGYVVNTGAVRTAPGPLCCEKGYASLRDVIVVAVGTEERWEIQHAQSASPGVWALGTCITAVVDVASVYARMVIKVLA
jgi:hypothetical protein